MYSISFVYMYTDAGNEHLIKALEEGFVTYSVSSVYIQGEAQSGKTSLKSLILSLPYDELNSSSISMLQVPLGSFSIDRYGSTDGKVWTPITDIEVDINETKESLENHPSKLVDHCLRLSHHKERLHFIDFSGKIQFQKLLLAFMPPPSVLILVINLSKSFTEPSTQLQKCSDNDDEEHFLNVQDTLKQVLSAVASNAQQYRLAMKDSKYIKNPAGKLNVITVGTHRDKYEELLKEGKKVEILKKKQETLNSILFSVEGTCDIIYASQPPLYNPLHVIDGRKVVDCPYNDRTLEKILSSLKRQAYQFYVPLKWHIFDVILRKKARKSFGVLNKSTCEELGKTLSMDGPEVNSALEYFHILKKLFYYHDSPVNDVIFVELNSLTDIVRELVGLSSVKQTGLSKEASELAQGIVSVRLLRLSKAYTNIAGYFENFSTKVFDLLKHLKIAAQLPLEGKFLMPALLPVRNVCNDYLLPNSMPLVFYFNNAVPIGLFCAVIVHLLSDSDNKWRITFKDSNFSNYFTLERNLVAGLGLKIVIVEKLQCIEIYCDRIYGRCIAKEAMKKAIQEVMKEKLIDNEEPIPAFYCMCSDGKDHVARVEDNVFIICNKTAENQDDRLTDREREQYWSWFMNRQEIEDMKKQRKSYEHIRHYKKK